MAMHRMTPRDVKMRFDALHSVRRTVEEHWQLIERYVVPGRGKFFQDERSEHELTWRRRELYDSTAPMAAQSLAASIHGSLTSPSIKWFDLRFRNPLTREKQEAKEWLEDTGERMFKAIQDSNFNLEAAESYMDLVSFGTTVLVEEPANEFSYEGVEFQTALIRQCFFEMNFDRSVRNFYRRLELTASQLVDKFGDEVPERIRQQHAQAGEVDRKYTVIFCIYQRDDYKDANTQSLLAPQFRPFGWMYVMHDDATQIGEDGGYYEQPAFVARWRMMSGSMWGFSPAMLALPDILSLNEMVRLILRAGEKVLDPATITSERGLLGDLDLEPGGLTVVRDVDQLKPYESGARFDVSEMQKENLQTSIRNVFHVDQLQLKESPAMTATEVRVRYELMQRLLGPTLGRLTNDFLDPLIMRTFAIMLRGGALAPPPDDAKDEQGILDIEYTGPLAKAQKMIEVEGMERWVGSMVALSEVFPELRDLVDVDDYGRNLADVLGVPSSNVNDVTKVARVRRLRAQAAAQERKLAMAQAEGEAMRAGGEGYGAMKDSMGEAGAAQALQAAVGQGRPPGTPVQ
jgi:hypothetical protein